MLNLASNRKLEYRVLPSWAIKAKGRKRIQARENLHTCKAVPHHSHVLPFQIDGCDAKHNSFEPKDHEEPLWEGAISDALTITASLQTEWNI